MEKQQKINEQLIKLNVIRESQIYFLKEEKKILNKLKDLGYKI